MIVDLILLLVKGILVIILSPLSIISITIDFTTSIPIVFQFLQIIVYVIPWANILPIIIFIIGLFLFRTVLAIIKTVWKFIPIIGN